MLNKETVSNFIFTYLPWTPIHHKYVIIYTISIHHNILTAVILKDRLFAMIFLVLCITVHMLTKPSPWKHLLKVVTLGRISQECLVLWCLTSSAPGTCQDQARLSSFVNIFDLMFFLLFGCIQPLVVHVDPCMEPFGRWCHLLLKGVGTALTGTV